MKKNQNNCIFVIFTFIFLLCILTSCLEEIVFHDKAAKKRVQFYKSQPRDKKLQGWWEKQNKYNKNGVYFEFYDLITGKEIYVYGDGDRFTNYWFTFDSVIYEAMYSKGWPNGICEINSYYSFKGENILEISRFPIGECRRDDPNTEWLEWKRITDHFLLDSLKQYEPLHDTIPTKKYIR